MNRPDIIVVGTGPAGISAAWPLVEAGLTVLLLDAGTKRLDRPAGDRPPLAALRASDQGWSSLLGHGLSALRDVGFASPKLRTAAPPGFGEGVAEANRIRATGFRQVGAFALGGLSSLWGAVAPAYDRSDMAGWPISPSDLADSYRRVAVRIGLSGSDDDDLATAQGVGLPLQPPLAPTGAAAMMLERYRARGGTGDGFRLGLARNAVLSAGLGRRRGCTLCKGCMWGCPQGSIYTSADEVEDLLRHPNARLETGWLVETLRRDGDGWTVAARDLRHGDRRDFSAPRVVLAAGALATTRLALVATGRIGIERPLVSAPCFAFAAVMPSRLGTGLDGHGFGMAQLAFDLRRPGGPGDAVFGSLYEADGFAVADLAAGLPLTRRGAASLFGLLMPALLIGLGYVPGRWSRNRVRLTADGALEVNGGVADGHGRELKEIGAGLGRHFRRLGAWMLPGSLQPFSPGTEVHYAGSLAMGEMTDCGGEMTGAPGLFIADGAALPGVSAKHHTFTMMANADRIGQRLATAKLPERS
ncbi:GMC oxidoreductase [Magnetospirillum sp. SS-4]|uniref:GMC oxidoreductase n=1 Tax=Magnetospirillum sp. SS-4 TaxID=2681465 RepID=UPI0013804953|nr:GMC oxidoreductase [Magnetospirillum sp. SS-4]CAA7621330.1 conserved hypothetical protein [Magnetospirillum sp. SS-4]